MTFVALSETALPPGAICATHPGVLALSSCRRCGAFVCADCSRERAGLRFCSTCLAHEDIDYLEATRKRFWGKRDFWVWMFAMTIPSTLGATLDAVLEQRWLSASLSLAHVAILIAYVSLWPRGRVALFLIAAYAMWNVHESSLQDFSPTNARIVEGPNFVRYGMYSAVVMIFLFAWAAYVSPRNRLAFRLPVTDGQLQRVYDSFVANPLAKRAAVYGVLSVLFPPAGPFTLWLSLSAQKRARAQAFPPVGGSSLATVGLVGSLCSCALLVLIVVAAAFG